MVLPAARLRRSSSAFQVRFNRALALLAPDGCTLAIRMPCDPTLRPPCWRRKTSDGFKTHRGTARAHSYRAGRVRSDESSRHGRTSCFGRSRVPQWPHCSSLPAWRSCRFTIVGRAAGPLVTVLGWFAILGGVMRMFAPQATTSGATWVYGLLVALLAVGVVLTFKGYSRRESEEEP